jgi:hypothetical protein
MQALRLYAGPKARQYIEKNGLSPQDIRVIPGAAGGPKGLVLGPLDRFLFGNWLAASRHRIDLVGASIGAWRMATACLNDPAEGFRRLERDYIGQHYEPPPGRKMPPAEQVSAEFARSLLTFYGGRVHEVLNHPRWKLHMVTSHGRGLLRREGKVRTPLGYLGAFLTNAVSRRAMGAWLERVVFSVAEDENAGLHEGPVSLPFEANDYRTRHFALTESNFYPAMQASCSIPFMLQAVHDIPGASPGAYWDGGITDYHLHLDYRKAGGLVLYPHFQKAVVPGWLDKAFKSRHKATPFLDNMLLLAPNPEWVQSVLPNAKLPDRTDFTRYDTQGKNGWQARQRVWQQAVNSSTQLAEEFARWLERPDLSQVQAL